MSVSTMNTVRELAVMVPGATRVFEQFGIDYCCGGSRTLSEACQTSSIPVAEVVEQLEAARNAVNPGDKLRNWQAESLTALAAHIVETHHFFTKQELARLEKLLDKVCSRHGENHPELQSLSQLFQHLKHELIPHMLKEEQVLFPYIARLEDALSEQRAVVPPFFGTVQNPVRKMAAEHDSAGELLAEMRNLTNGYAVPEMACNSFRALYQALQELEADLHQHIHLENNILFPRAIALENAAGVAWESVGGQFQPACFQH